MTEPGQPCERRSGIGAGPFPSSWMKWTSIPASGTLNWRNPLSLASCARQSKPVRQ